MAFVDCFSYYFSHYTHSFSFLDSVGQVRLDETPESLWGDDKSDPRDALRTHGFQMRQVVLTRKPRSSRRGGGRRVAHDDEHDASD